MKHRTNPHILPWLLLALGTANLHAAFDLEAWKTKYGTALTPSAFYSTRPGPWGDYFSTTSADCANASFLHLGPLGIKAYPYDQALTAAVFAALYPPTLVDASGLIQNSFGVLDTPEGGPSDGKVYPGDTIIEMEDQRIKTATDISFPMTVLSQSSRGLEIHAGQLIDAAEGRGAIKLKVVRAALTAYTSPVLTAPATTTEVVIDITGQDFIRITAVSDNNCLTNWINPRFETAGGSALYLNAQTISQKCGYSSPQMGKDATGATVYDGATAITNTIGTRNNSMIEYAVPSGYSLLKFKVQASGSGSATASIKTRKTTIGTTPVTPRQFDVNGAPVLPPELAPYVETIEYAIPQIGSFGSSYDSSSQKVANYSSILACRLAREQNSDGSWPSAGGDYASGYFRTSMAALGLMATGDPAYATNISKAAYYCANSNADGWAYPRGVRLMFLAEYYLRTKDAGILPGLQQAVNDAQDVILADFICGHTFHPGYGNPGYCGATGTIATGLAIASHTPVIVDTRKLDNVLERIQELAGSNGGCFPYGRAIGRTAFPDTPSTGQSYSNGSGGVLATNIRGGPQYITSLFKKKFGVTATHGDTDGGHASECLTFLMGSLACAIWGDDAHKANMSTLLWRITLKRDYAGYINMNTNRLEYHGADGGCHGGPTYDTGGYLVLFNEHKHNLAITGKPEAQAQVFPATPPTYDVDRKLYWKVLNDWNIVDAVLGSKMPAALQPKLLELRSMPLGSDLGTRVLSFLQREALAAATSVSAISGLTTPEKQYYCEMLLGIGHDITVACTDSPAPTTGNGNYTFSLNGYTTTTLWAAWGGPTLSSDPAASTRMTGTVVLSDPSGLYLTSPVTLNFLPGTLNPTTSFQVPVTQQVTLAATFNYTVGGSLAIAYSKDIIINPTVPFNIDARSGDFTNLRRVWVPGNSPKPYQDWILPINLPSGQQLPGASKHEGGIGAYTYDNGTLVTPDSAYLARIAGAPCGFWVTSGDRMGENAVLGVNILRGPVLTTTAVSTVTANSAASGGSVTADNGWPVTQRGICWSTSPYPTIYDNKTSNGMATGTFSAPLTSLLPGTIYHVRAYAVNASGTSYGADLAFTTPGASGVWTTAGGGSWPATTNWSGGVVADGADGIADSGAVTISSNATVTLDGNRSIGGMIFGNVASTGNWILNPGTGGSLSLDIGTSGDPTITVNGNTATINTVLLGTDGLVKAGTGTLALTAANVFTGDIAVSAGTLQVSGSVSAGSPVNVAAGASLTGTGTVGAATTVDGTLAPGNAGIGTLTINGPLVLTGGTAMEISKSAATCDRATGMTAVTYGGTLTVTNLSGTPAAGDKYILFTASSYSGTFASVTLPALTTGLKWDTSGLAVDGSIQVGFDPTISGQPANKSVGIGVSATFTVTAAGIPAPACQWQVSTDSGGTWNNISGATANSYATPPVVSGDNNKQFRCVVSNSLATVNSNAVVLTVTANALPAFTSQPANVVLAAAGPTATFSVTVTGTPAPTYQWQVSTNAGGTWTNVAGATSASYAFTSAAGDDNKAFHCIATNSEGSVTSNMALLLIAPVPTWTNNLGGSWPTAGNWFNNTVASGTGITADFSRLNLPNDTTVTVDGARTIGNLKFADATASHNWTLDTGSADPLTLATSSGTPTITVTNMTATVSTVLAGTNGMAKAGGGNLVLTESNAYTGGTTLSAGQLTINNANALAGGALTITGGTLGNTSGAAITLAGAQSWNGSFTFAGPNNLTVSGAVTLGASPVLTVQGGDLTVSGAIAGAYSLTKAGANTLNLPTGSGYSGGTIVNSGKIYCTAGGWYGTRSIGTGTLTVNSGATAYFTNAHGFGVDPGGRAAVVNGGTLQFNAENAISALTMTGGSVVGGEMRLGSITIPINASAAGTTFATGLNLCYGSPTLNVANGTAAVDLLVSGGIYSSGGFTKSGAGFMKLTGTGTYSGTTTISTGTVQLDGGSLGGGAVTAASGTTLCGSGSIGGATTVSGTLILGVDGAIGTLAFSNPLTLAATCATTMKLSKTGTTLANDQITGVTTLTCGGTLTVTSSGDALAVGDTFRLLSATTYSGTFSSVTLPVLTGGLVWDTSKLYVNGSISLGKKSQTISFGALPSMSYGDVLVLTATASSGLPIIYASSNPAVAFVQYGDYVMTMGVGTTTITASQAGDTYYNAATDVSQSLTVGAVLPVVVTTAVVPVTTTTATSGGSNIWDGGAAITERGVCWNTSANPTVANNRTTDGTGTANFTSTVTGLTGNATYYIRAYVKNAAGYAYGDNIIYNPPLDGVWIVNANGNWSTATNWSGGLIPQGYGSTASFATLNITADRTVTLDVAASLGAVTFGDTTASNNWILTPGTGGSLTMTALSGTPTITVNNQTATLNTPIAGTTGLIKAGTGTLCLGAANPLTGPITIQGGIVRQTVNSTFAPAIDLTITNAALEVRYGSYNTNWVDATSLTLGGGATLRAAAQYQIDNGDIGFKDNITVIGTNTVSATGGSYGKHNWLSGGMSGDAAAYVNLSGGLGYGAYADRHAIILESAYGNWTGYLGTINAVNDVTINGSVALRNAKVIVTGTIGLYANGSIGEFGELTGAGTLEANSKTGGEWKIGNLGTSTTYAGIINGASKLTKVGAGTLTLTNASVHTGGTAVSAGTLLSNNTTGSGTGTGTVSLASGATLGGTGAISGAVTVDGTLAPGNNGVGILTTGAVTLDNSAAIACQISNWTGVAGTGYDQLVAASLNVAATSLAPVTVAVAQAALTNYADIDTDFILVQTTGGITGFDATKFSVNTSAFPFGTGTWSVVVSGNNLVLRYRAALVTPTFNSNPITGSPARVGIAYSSTLAGLATDPNGDTLTFSKTSGPTWLSVAANGALTGTPAAGDLGTNGFIVRVSDPALHFSEATLQISVVVNSPPGFTSNPITGIGNATVNTAYSGQTLAGKATDPDLSTGDSITFLKVSGPAWLTVAATGALGGTPSVLDSGVNSFTVKVTDSFGLYATATLPITVTALTDIVKLNNTTNLTTATAWTSSVLPTASGIAVWNSTWTGSKTTATTTTAATWGGIRIDNPGANVIIPGTAALTVGVINTGTTRNLTFNSTPLTFTGLIGSTTLTYNRNATNDWTTSLNSAEALRFTGTLALRGGTATTSAASMTTTSWLALGGSSLTQLAGTAFALDTGATAANALDFVMTDAWNSVPLQLSALSGYGTIRSDWGATAATRVVRVTESATTTFNGLFLGHTTRNLVLQKAGAGSLTMAGLIGTQAGTPEVDLSVEAGTLVLTADNARVNAADSTVIATGATLQLGAAGTTGTLGTTNAVTDNGTLAVNHSNAVAIANAITGTGGLSQLGAGTTTLSGASGYTGTTAVSAGTLLVTGGLTGTTAATIAASSTLQLGNGGTSGSLPAACPITDNGSLIISRSDALAMSGAISGSGTVAKQGAGTLTLGGTHNFTGATTISAGTLALTGSLAGTSMVTVASGATLTGTGSVTNAVSVSGTIAPGTTGAGTLTTGALTLAISAAIPWQITDWTGAAGTGFDQISATSLNITATPANPVAITITEQSLANFTETSRTFVLVQTSTGITNFAANKFAITSSGFTTGHGTWAIQQSGNNLVLAYTRSNTAPSFATNPLTLGGTQGTAISGTVTATDPDLGESLTYAKVSGPAWLSVASNGSLSGTPGNADVGLNVFSVRVTDSMNATGTATLNITVANVNDPPVFTASPITGAAGTQDVAYSGTLAGTATDPDSGYGDTLTFSKVSGPSWLSVAANGILSGSPGSGDLGLQSIVVRVTDAASASATATLQIQVNPANPDANGNGILDAWEATMFGNANPGSNAASDDGDGDGISNLMEYALNTDPLVSNSNPVAHDLETVAGKQYLRLAIPKNPAASNLTYTVETCDDLNGWSAADTVIETDTTGQLVVRDKIPTTAATRRFIHLKVSVKP